MCTLGAKSNTLHRTISRNIPRGSATPDSSGEGGGPAEIEAILQLRQLPHHDDYPRAAFVNGWIISFRYRFTDHLSLSYKKKKKYSCLDL